MALIVALLILILVLGAVVLFAYTMRTAPYVRTSHKVLDDMLALAEIKPGEHVIDLGSGDGRLLEAALTAGATAEGYELNPILVEWSRRKLRNRATIHLANFFSSDVTRADVVFIYSLPQSMRKLEQRLQSQLKPGARVVSNAFHFPNWPADATEGHATRYVA